MNENLTTDLNAVQQKLWRAQAAHGGCDGFACCDGMGVVTIEVPQGHPAWGKAFKCVCQKDKSYDWQRTTLRGRLGLPAHFQDCSFEWLQERNMHLQGKLDAVQAAYEMATNQRHTSRPWLMLMGAPGMGKTALAASIAKAKVEQLTPTLWLDYSEFINDLYRAQARQFNRDNGDTDAPANPYQWIDDAARVPFLVLDDFGDPNRQAPVSDFQREKIWQLLNMRHSNRLPTVITTNLDLDGLRRMFSQRIAERIIESAASFTLAGKNWRTSERIIEKEIA